MMMLISAALAWIALAAQSAPAAQALATATVGMTGRVEQVVIAGPELTPKPFDTKSKMVVRITKTYPHGTDFRYDLEFQGFEPGPFDLVQYMQTKDGSAAPATAVPVAVTSILPAGVLKPSAPEAGAAVHVGGYKMLMIAGGAAWVAGLGAILYFGRRRRAEPHGEAARPRSLAERLQPLVERAVAGTLSKHERAGLELSLIAFWRRRLGLEDRSQQEVLAAVRAHADAGPLLIGLEEWLHRPQPPERLDLAKLLAPYRNLPPDALELGARR